MAKPKNHTLACPFCNEPLDVGDETRAVVAHCFSANKSCSGKQWGSASTRVNYGTSRGKDGEPVPTHVLQIDPPAEENEAEAARAA